jgi:hypothetical protein
MTPELLTLSFSVEPSRGEKHVKGFLEARDGSVFRIIDLPGHPPVQEGKFLGVEFYIVPKCTPPDETGIIAPSNLPGVKYPPVPAGEPHRLDYMVHDIELPKFDRVVRVETYAAPGTLEDEAVFGGLE